ncbi:TIGR02996 domain-containing protein [Tuwongella immobilis]|uniref:Repeat-companion domain protein n=1 Tax=Tuwongella immobilis TaxID=692036 RepID=A0A6C2YJF0_9BACT|nr:TIGR02996 domain-containing protein [Tuwongella immobilis]VIP01235.1 unnamed protein product [Tuwongella immobilis]VTR97896.1 unnamed protein product [Tuwongella immobilis]
MQRLTQFARSDTEQALLRACLEQLESDDVTPFWAYADWLEEQGESLRAAVMRQMTTPEAAMLAPLKSLHRPVPQAQEAIQAWQQIAGVPNRRGLFLVRGLPVGWNDPRSHGPFDWADRLHAWPLLRYVQILNPTSRELADLAITLAGTQLHGLALRNRNPTTMHPTAMLRHAAWPNLRSLILEGAEVTEPSLRTLGEWRQLPSLQRLSLELRPEPRVSAVTLWQPLTQVAWRELEIAELLQHREDGEAMSRIQFPALESLTLRAHLPRIFPELRIHALWEQTPRLRELHLRFCGIDDEAITAIITPLRDRVERLSLDLNAISDAPGRIFRGWAGSPLRWLGFHAIEFGGRFWNSLIRSDLPAGVTLRVIQHRGTLAPQVRTRLEARFAAVHEASS